MKKILLCVIGFVAFVWGGLEYNSRLTAEEIPLGLFEKVPKTDRPGKYLDYHRGIRTRDNESSPEYEQNYKWKELRQAKQHAAARKRSSSGRVKSNGVVEWVERGPGNVPGRTRALLNVPGDPSNNTWLAGSATGGIWKTKNGGLSWSEKSRDFPALPISSFSATTDGSVIYAATGEFVSSVFSSIGNGIFRSLDKGETWQQIPATNNHPDFSVITRVITHPSNPALLVATTVPHNLTKDKTSAVMRSSDGGATWKKVLETPGIFEQVIAAPDNFSTQYVSQNRVGIWKSTDAGLTWNLSNTGMSAHGRIEIAISRLNSDHLYASAEGTLSGTQSDLYYSADAGATWSLVDIKFNNASIDFFEGQGFYDNTVMIDPFNDRKVYFGGVSLFKATLGTVSSAIDNWKIHESGTQQVIFLQSFQNIEWDNARLVVDGSNPKMTVQLRFGAGKSQMAHRFFVPSGSTSGVDVGSYTYQDYVSVPFQAWDVTNPSAPRQLMVSFRDQNRNGFDLVPSKLSDSDAPDEHSREYVYIHTLTYNRSQPSSSITVDGGQERNLAYNIFPSLAENAAWPTSFPESHMEIRHSTIARYSATTETIADGRAAFDGKNKANQAELDKGVHPDHHCMVPIVVNAATKTYKLLLGNDGGVFISKVSANPGASEGDWIFRGIGFNTSQFYGADKRPGHDQYIGGMQDNGTRVSPPGESAVAASAYKFAIGGDGFEVLWNNKDDNSMLGSVYYGQISRTTDGGATWETAHTGLNPNTQEFPFVTKLANSKDFPDRVFTVSQRGVYVSSDFGRNWALTAIDENFANNGSFVDVEVSRANANIVWAGSGMSNGQSALRHLHVSRDGGKSFTPTANYTTVELGNITKLASHPTEENTAYALFSFSETPKILRTRDLGRSWEDISGFESGAPSARGFPDVAVYCLYVRPDNPDIIWAGTEIGIVESTDNGESWSLVDGFPNVAVWDMKGQDNQIVIATHGRGIWTANLQTDQVNGKTPQIILSGTSPVRDLMLRIQSSEEYDSLEIVIDAAPAKTLYDLKPGVMDLAISKLEPGEKNIRMICYKGDVPHQSAIYSVTHTDILAPKNTYSTYFSTISDLQLRGLSLQHLPDNPKGRKSLQTSHDYSVNETYEILIRTPITVSSTLPVLYYRDIAIIEPENDSIVVEATKNGLDWIALAPSYDAGFSGDVAAAWTTAFNAKRPGSAAMYIKHELNYNEKFAPGDLILFRFRLISGPSVTAWGWALDYISIQEQPLSEVPSMISGTEFNVFPNPSDGMLTADYSLDHRSEISLQVIDVYGRSYGKKVTAQRNAGYNKESLDLSSLQNGTYILLLETPKGRLVRKITILK